MIEADDSSNFGSLVWAATTTPSSLSTNSLPNGTVFWRVRAFNSDGVAGPYSAVRTVVVGSGSSGPLPAPTLDRPGNDARFSPGQSITFDWSDVAGAGGYTIQIDDSQSFSAPLTAERDRRGLVVRHEHAADAAAVVARARERRRRVVVSAASGSERLIAIGTRTKTAGEGEDDDDGDERDRGGDACGPVEQADAGRRRRDVDGDERRVRRVDQIVEAEDVDAPAA